MSWPEATSYPYTSVNFRRPCGMWTGSHLTGKVRDSSPALTVHLKGGVFWREIDNRPAASVIALAGRTVLAHDVFGSWASRHFIIRRTMSRSIHVTRQYIARARRFRYANRDKRAALLDDLEARHLRKRRMKWAMRQKLGPVQFPGAPVTADEVAISFDRRNPFACYPVSETDLRAILSRLPLGVLDG